MATGLVQYDQSKPDVWNSPALLDGAIGGSQIVAAKNADGRLDVFFIDRDSKLYHSTQQHPGGNFLPKSPLNGNAKQMAVALNKDGRLELFWVATNGELCHSYQGTAGSASWVGASFGRSAKQVAMGTHADGRLEVFTIDTDDTIYHNTQKTPGGEWTGAAFGGSAKQIVLAQNKDLRLELFFIGMDNVIHHHWQTAPNSATWAGGALGGEARQIAVTRNADGRLEIFFVGMNNHIYHNWQTAPGSDWKGDAGYAGHAQEISIAHAVDGRLELLYIGKDGCLYHSWQQSLNGPWMGDHKIAEATHVAAISNNDGRIAVFYFGSTEAAPILKELTFTYDPIVFETGVAIGGASRITLRSDGTYTFSGHLHDSGLLAYNFVVGWAIKDTNDKVYTLGYGGSTSGTLEDGSSNEIWTVDSNNIDIRNNWPAISNRTFAVASATVKIDYGKLIGYLLSIAGVALAVFTLPLFTKSDTTTQKSVPPGSLPSDPGGPTWNV